MSTPAGWYPDPEREGAVRWWDGESWGPQQDAAADVASTDATQGDATPTSTSGYDFSGGQSTTHDAATGQQQQTSGYDFSGGQTGAVDAGQPQTSGYDFSGGSAGGDVAAPTPSWEQSGAQQYGQASAPAYAGQEGAPQYGGQQYGEQQYGQPQQFGTQYGQQGAPKKRNMGLILGLSIGGGVVLIALIVIAAIVISNLFAQQGGQQPDGQPSQSSVPLDVQLQVPQGGEATQEFTITESGTYEIAANNVSGSGDPVLVVEGDNGFYGEDDDGGDQPLDSLLVAQLEPGTYTATVTDWSDDDAFTAQLTVNQG